ncbi:hypothetical protein DAI22_02g201050 [Oryza sativa Japonica Group]|nr:hypothetical protein DAI22_02g201050 [Oryza sativa Japonica Group]
MGSPPSCDVMSNTSICNHGLWPQAKLKGEECGCSRKCACRRRLVCSWEGEAGAEGAATNYVDLYISICNVSTLLGGLLNIDCFPCPIREEQMDMSTVST